MSLYSRVVKGKARGHTLADARVRRPPKTEAYPVDGALLGSASRLRVIQVAVNKNTPPEKKTLGTFSLRNPSQGLERSLCCCFARQRLP